MDIMSRLKKGVCVLKIISKTKLKSQMLKILRDIERAGEDVIITDRAKAVLRITKYHENDSDALAFLRDAILEYKNPDEPV